MIPPKLKTGPKSRYEWETMKRGDFREGDSREGLISGYKNFCAKVNRKVSYTTRKTDYGTYLIYRTR